MTSYHFIASQVGTKQHVRSTHRTRLHARICAAEYILASQCFPPGIAWSNATTGFPVAPTSPTHDQFLDASFNPIIVRPVGYLEALMPGVLYNAVKSAHNQTPEFMNTLKITDAVSFVVFANDLLRWTPTESCHGRDVYHILTMIYFIFGQPGLAELQNAIHPSQAGQQLTWLSSWLVVYAQLIGLWMDNPLSINNKTLQTFRESHLYNVSEAIEPEGGWKTFNEFFSRKLKKGASTRPRTTSSWSTQPIAHSTPPSQIPAS